MHQFDALRPFEGGDTSDRIIVLLQHPEDPDIEIGLGQRVEVLRRNPAGRNLILLEVIQAIVRANDATLHGRTVSRRGRPTR